MRWSSSLWLGSGPYIPSTQHGTHPRNLQYHQWYSVIRRRSLLKTYRRLILGLGVGLTASATFVALNHYFVKRRGQAVGFSLAGTAFGMMLMPQAVRLLLEAYDFRGTILVLGAFAFHALVGSTLLQPAKWHFINEMKDEEEATCQKVSFM